MLDPLLFLVVPLLGGSFGVAALFLFEKFRKQGDDEQGGQSLEQVEYALAQNREQEIEQLLEDISSNSNGMSFGQIYHAFPSDYYGSLHRGRPASAVFNKKKHNMNDWYYQRLKEQTDEQHAAETLAGEVNDYSGLAAIKYELARAASEFIRIHVEEEGGEPAQAFNNVTSGWPSSLKSLVAAYEFVNENFYTEGYEEDVREFAKLSDWLDADTLSPVNDEVFNGEFVFGTNPFNNDSLSDEEARLVIGMRLRGFDEAELDFDAITDMDDFNWWLDETKDVSVAVEYHVLGTVLSTTAREVVAPPSEWQVLDPHNVEQEECRRCGRPMAEVETNHGPGLVDTDGNTGGRRLELGERFFVEDGSGAICQRCVTRETGRDAERTLHYRDGEFEVILGVRGSVFEDHGLSVSDVNTADEVPPDVLDRAIAVATNRATGWHYVEPRRSNVEDLLYAVGTKRELPVDDDGPLAFETNRHDRLRAWFPEDKPETAREIKDAMDEQQEATA